MKFAEPSPYADPEAAALKLVEIANTVEAVQDGRIFIGKRSAWGHANGLGVGDTKTAFGRPPRAECGGMSQSQAGVTCSDCTDHVSGIRHYPSRQPGSCGLSFRRPISKHTATCRGIGILTATRPKCARVPTLQHRTARRRLPPDRAGDRGFLAR
jgi:hypothetical protein